jgi:N-acetylglucosaminyl-diphospho-decaprenol L-rhamnosyltransferase
MTGHVAICIVGFRNSADVLRCLSALEASSWADFEVVVCENGGETAFAELQSQTPSKLAGGQAVKIVSAGGNLGFAGGVNRCLAEADRVDAWWILNPDTEPEPNALGLMIQRLDQNDCDAVGCTLFGPSGLVQAFGGRWQPWLARAVSLGLGTAVDQSPDPSRIEALQTYLNGASMLVGRRFLETVGPMREDYFLYCEEVEWCLRARSLGLRLGFAPGARVLHRQGSSTGAVTDWRARPKLPIYLDERNRMLLTRDLFPGLLPVAATAALTRILVGGFRRGAWRQIGYGVEGWWTGLMGRRGPPAAVAA